MAFAKIRSLGLEKFPMHLTAPEGCLQYYMGVSNQLISYNWNAGTGLEISNVDYTVCIR